MINPHRILSHSRLKSGDLDVSAQQLYEDKAVDSAESESKGENGQKWQGEGWH